MQHKSRAPIFNSRPFVFFFTLLFSVSEYQNNNNTSSSSWQVTMNTGTSGKSGMEDLLGWDNVDLELWHTSGLERL